MGDEPGNISSSTPRTTSRSCPSGTTGCTSCVTVAGGGTMDDSPPSAIPLTSSKLSRKNRKKKNNNAVKQSHRKTINVNYSSTEHVLQIRAQNPSHTPRGTCSVPCTYYLTRTRPHRYVCEGPPFQLTEVNLH